MKYLFFIAVLIMMIVPGCGNNQKSEEVTRKQIGAYSQETKTQYFQLAQCRLELTCAERAVDAYQSQEMDFLVSTGYNEEKSQIEAIQKKWKARHWKEYALIIERLNDALMEAGRRKDAYCYTLNKLGFDENNFNIWYYRMVSDQIDPKGYIDSMLTKQ